MGDTTFNVSSIRLGNLDAFDFDYTNMSDQELGDLIRDVRNSERPLQQEEDIFTVANWVIGFGAATYRAVQGIKDSAVSIAGGTVWRHEYSIRSYNATQEEMALIVQEAEAELEARQNRDVNLPTENLTAKQNNGIVGDDGSGFQPASWPTIGVVEGAGSGTDGEQRTGEDADNGSAPDPDQEPDVGSEPDTTSSTPGTAGSGNDGPGAGGGNYGVATGGSGQDKTFHGFEDNDPRSKGQPIILDLNGNGIELAQYNNAVFDWDDDGFYESGTWAASTDGFLVLDLNADGTRGAGDGKIDQTRELVWSLWGNEGDTDLQALARAFDDDNNGVINAADSIWDELRVWQDLDEDGETDDGELKTLAEWGISEISVAYDDGSAFGDTSDDVEVFNNTLHGVASFVHDGSAVTLADGATADANGLYTATGGVGDVSLSYNNRGWRRIETDIGFDIEFETGELLKYAEMAPTDAPNIDLGAMAIDGVTGNASDNVLDATNQTRNVQIDGGDGNDTVLGGSANDFLSGGAGADHILGGDGNDLIFIDAQDVTQGLVEGGSGQDTVFGLDDVGFTLNMTASGFEVAQGGSGNDAIAGGNTYVDLLIRGGDGADSVTGGNGSDFLSGDVGDDLVLAGIGDDLVLGGSDNDTLGGGAGDDVLDGSAGFDLINGGDGDDSLYGGSDNDTLNGHAGDDLLKGGEGNDVLDGSFGDDILRGGEGADTLTFWAGDDELHGDDGDDLFLVSGADYWGETAYGWAVLYGGVGDDRVEIDMASTDFTLQNMSNNVVNQHRLVSVGSTYDTSTIIDLVDVETLVFSDGVTIDLLGDTSLSTRSFYIREFESATFGDGVFETWGYGTYGHRFLEEITTNGSDPETYNIWTWDDFWYYTHLDGFNGNDALKGHSSQSDLIEGGSGNDTIEGLGGNDTISGQQGDDRLYGGNGHDDLSGNSGSDYVSGGSGNDVINGHSGADYLEGDDGDDLINGGDGADMLIGGVGADTLVGWTGDDTVFGGEGDDVIRGHAGSDNLHGYDGDDIILGHEGYDYITGGEGSDFISGGQGFDRLYGNAGNDTLEGGDDDDLLYGNDGDDSLAGDAGADILQGGAGADTLDGGSGNRDKVAYTNSKAAVTVDLYAGTASGGDAEGDTFIGIENVAGSNYDDNLTGSGGNSTVEGGGGNDVITSYAGNDDIFGGSGSDTIASGAGADRVFGDVEQDFDGAIHYEYFNLNNVGAVSLDYFDTNAPTTQGFTTTLDVNAVDEREDSTGDYFGVVYRFTVSIETAGSYLWFGSTNEDVSLSINGELLFETFSQPVSAGFLEMTEGTHEFTVVYQHQTGAADLSLNVSSADAGIEIGNLLDSGLIGSATDHAYVNKTLSDDIFSGNGNDTVDAGYGDDTVYAGNNDDLVYGGIGNDLLIGQSGLDEIHGGEGDDTIYGGSEDDVLYGNDGADVFYGGVGDDTIVGGAGNDAILGKQGNDIFVFADGFGNDTVGDFEVANTLERIDLSEVSEISDYADLLASHVSQVAAHTVIDDGAGNSVMLKWVALDELTPDSFLF